MARRARIQASAEVIRASVGGAICGSPAMRQMAARANPASRLSAAPLRNSSRSKAAHAAASSSANDAIGMPAKRVRSAAPAKELGSTNTEASVAPQPSMLCRWSGITTMPAVSQACGQTRALARNRPSSASDTWIA